MKNIQFRKTYSYRIHFFVGSFSETCPDSVTGLGGIGHESGARRNENSVGDTSLHNHFPGILDTGNPNPQEESCARYWEFRYSC